MGDCVPRAGEGVLTNGGNQIYSRGSHYTGAPAYGWMGYYEGMGGCVPRYDMSVFSK